MKLKELVEGSSHKKRYNEKEALEAVKHWGPAIQFMENPSEAVKLAAVQNNSYALKFIDNPSQLILLTALKDQRFINQQFDYDRFIKKHFANNTLLMKKWLRYGQVMRES